MVITKPGLLKAMSGLPFVGTRCQTALDKFLLQQLDLIEGRFGSANARFVTQLHDLYDCLKDLQGPLEIDVRRSHGYAVAVHTKTSGDAQRLLDRLHQGFFINPDEYFTSARRTNLLDWYSNADSIQAFAAGMKDLLQVYCNNHPRPELTDGPAGYREIPVNEVTENFVTSRFFKLVVLDLIQMLTAVLSQRLGG